ncbi:hypothetical protein Vafri_9533, partial [Volvox africanus]
MQRWRRSSRLCNPRISDLPPCALGAPARSSRFVIVICHRRFLRAFNDRMATPPAAADIKGLLLIAAVATVVEPTVSTVATAISAAVSVGDVPLECTAHAI